MKRNIKTVIIFASMILLLIGYVLYQKNTSHTNSQAEAKTEVKTPAFSLHSPDEVIHSTLLNPFVNQTKIKILGDSITAGVGSTGYGVTTQRIANSEYFIPKQNSLSWANLFKQYVENKYDYTSMLVNPLNSQITSNLPKFSKKENDAKLKMSAYTKGEDAKWQFTFVGTEFKVYFTKHEDSGIVDIYVDGKLMGQHDLYSQNSIYGYQVSVQGLKQGQHKVELKAAGKHSKSKGNRIYVEAFEFQKTVNVQNWGVGGRDSEWIYELRDSLIEPDDDVVMIQIGTNDRRDMESPEALKMHLKAIIEKCIEEQKDIILLSANPTSVREDTLRENRHFTMLDVDMTIKALADEYGIKHISNYDAFLRYSDYTGNSVDTLLRDEVHPNDDGYKVMYENVMSSLGLSLERDPF